MLTEAQVVALEKAKAEKETHDGEFESEHPGSRGAQDTFYVGNLKGGLIYQQTFVDTYSKVASVRSQDTGHLSGFAQRSRWSRLLTSRSAP